MLAQINHFIVGLMDIFLGWLLRFPSDGRLIGVAVISALVLTVVRFWTTNQDSLRRCAADKSKLKTLVRAAKSNRDKDAVSRHRATLSMIAMQQLRQEGRPLLASLLPLVLLATWALNRLEFHPLQSGESGEFAAYFSISAVGKIAHIVPEDGLTATTGWIQEITAVTEQGPAQGIAIWHLTAGPGPEQRQLAVRFDGNTYQHPFRAGGGTYEAPVLIHNEPLRSTELKLRPVKLFGIVPGIPAMHFPAWLTGYLVLIIPLTFLLKKVLRVF